MWNEYNISVWIKNEKYKRLKLVLNLVKYLFNWQTSLGEKVSVLGYIWFLENLGENTREIKYKGKIE